jgi:predicted MFS family arabinose efflux permease
VLFTMREAPRDARPSSDANGFGDTLRQAFTELRRNRVVGYLVLMFGVLSTLYGAIEEYFSVYLDDRGGLSLTSIGAIYALVYVARTVGLELAHRLPGAPVPNAVRLLVVAGVVLATTVFPSGWWLALPIALYSTGAAIAEVLLQTRLQHGIEGTTRATVTSAAGVVEGIFEFPLYLSIGLVAQFSGWQAAFFLIALLTVIGSLGFRAFAPRDALN